MTTTKTNLILTLTLIFLWLLITIGNGWWIWSHYQTSIKADQSKVHSSITRLDIETLNKAAQILETPTQ